jgi:hypothetical protein
MFFWMRFDVWVLVEGFWKYWFCCAGLATWARALTSVFPVGQTLVWWAVNPPSSVSFFLDAPRGVFPLRNCCEMFLVVFTMGVGILLLLIPHETTFSHLLI